MDNYQKFIALSRYARYIDDENRRETWGETVARYTRFWRERYPEMTGALDEAHEAIFNLEVMPSMRAMMTAGKALDRDHTAGYNCAYLPMDSIDSFAETLHILMCGTGAGFSVERQYVSQLPRLPIAYTDSDSPIVVADSKEGWAVALRTLLQQLWAGITPTWDVSKVRPAGARLKTFGGRASGPAPLEDLFQWTVELFHKNRGKTLDSLQCHDLVCKIASIVVVGGVRRSALISLSNLTDQRMRHAKDGEFPAARYLANNSVVYTESPDIEIFMDEWLSLYRSRSGERGIFNRQAADKQVLKTGRREGGHEWGTNPCSEIILRPYQFCNLSEVVVRAEDTILSLLKKVEIATFLGTLQSTLTDFKFLRPIWKENCEAERLLGVSLTGIMDHPILNDPSNAALPEILNRLREHAVTVNAFWAKRLGIKPSAAITCVKPSGTVSQLVDSASGIHSRYAKRYIRRVRADVKDPLCQWMMDRGFPHEPDRHNPMVMVFSFPVAAPEGAVVEGERTAVGALQLWKVYQDHWCEHKPSITVHYKDHEFLEVGAWVYRNIDSISGVAFLPKDDHVYQQAPYEAVSEEQYQWLVESMPVVDWAQYREAVDHTTASQTLACTGGICEIVDLTQ